MIKFKKTACVFAAASLCLALVLPAAGCAENARGEVVLRVCSWEEYIDLGGWDDGELIEIENVYTDDGGVIGVNSMVDDFTEWFNENHDFNVRVEYSTFGTNEDLYNRLSLGDVYDIACPSDYMLMKLIAEENYVEFSDAFWEDEEENYYAQFVSQYIDGADGEGIFNKPEYDWHKKAACYMWGTLGIVYNPEFASAQDVSTWEMMLNEKYKKQVTIKDNVRDSYFAALGILNGSKITAETTSEKLSLMMNATDSETVASAEDVLKRIKENVYSFETDSGKADMVTGKVVANEQWSGDAVYIMDEAEGDEEHSTELWYSVPEECTNIWFDGWIKLKNGVDWTDERHEAAEAFVNFLSRPDNAVRNMYYIGYTSAIAGETVFEYMDYNYGAEEDAEETFEYDLSYFFGEGSYITADCSQFDFEDGENYIANRGRQLFAQYPPQNVIDRSVVMLDFGDRLADINQMWINVRCLDIMDFSPVAVGVVCGIIVIGAVAIT
ncbi:MAG: extracellular solute-binding protein, partial [Clostridia bacterium]|nr:extracellular solute-binding protein [Clostridia bacterium]